MKAATAIGIAVAIVGILFSAMMDGTSPAAFINMPALLIICVGTGGATLASVGMDSMKKIPTLYKLVFGGLELDLSGRVSLIVSLAEQARREGLLALDAQLETIDDEFTRKGLQLVVDGTDPELVQATLEAEIDGMIARHASGSAPFEKAGGFAPTIGILGTVMGLVHVLAEPRRAGDARAVDLLGVHRDAHGRRIGERHLPADRQPAEGDVRPGGRAAHAHARGDPRRAGRREPARRQRQAERVRAPGRARGGGEAEEDRGAPELREAA